MANREELDEHVVDITRVANNRGRVGMGIGKARGVPDAIHKAMDRARDQMVTVPRLGSTIPHEVTGICAGARVLMKPAAPGTGVIAAGNVRAVMKAAGIDDVLTKSLNSKNALSVVRATMDGLGKLRSVEQIARERGVPEEKVKPFWSR